MTSHGQKSPMANNGYVWSLNRKNPFQVKARCEPLYFLGACPRNGENVLSLLQSTKLITIIGTNRANMGKTLIGEGFTILNWEPTIVEQELMNGTFKVDLNESLDNIPEDIMDMEIIGESAVNNKRNKNPK